MNLHGSSRTTRLIGASFAIMMAGILSKCLGFVRTMVIAAVYGASSQVDAFVVAQNIPGMLFGLVGGALGTVVIPLFTRKRVAEGDEEAFRMLGTIWNAVILAALLIIIIGEFAMPLLVRLIAPGFRGEVYEQTITLGYIMMPGVLFTGLSFTASGVLNSFQVFGLPAFAGPLQNVIIIASVFTLGRVMGIKGLAFGTLMGMAAQLVILWLVLRNKGFRPGMSIDWRLPELRQMVMLSLPVAVGVGLGTVNALVDRILASSLPAGNVAAIDYSARLYTLPMTLLGSAIGTVLYPTFAEFAASRDDARTTDGIRRGLSVGTLGLFPISAGIFVLARPLTQVVYQRGMFDANATILTSGVLAMYVLGVPAMSWRDVASRAFYANGDTITPLKTGILSVAVNVALNLVLIRFMAARGLALATSIASWVGALSLMWLWDRKQSCAAAKILDSRFLSETVKVLAATAIMSIVVYFLWNHAVEQATASRMTDMSNMQTLSWLIPATFVGAVTYLLCAWCLKVGEFRFIVDLAKRGLRRLTNR